MLFWIFVIMVVGGFAMFALGFEKDWEIVECSGLISLILGVICTLAAIGIIATNHIGVDADVAKLNTRYDTLMFQYWNDIYENDNDLGKRDLYKDIQEWNEKIVWGREAQDDFWIGIFVPDIYDQFELIELEVSYG